MTDRGTPVAPMRQIAGLPAWLTAAAMQSPIVNDAIDELDHRLQDEIASGRAMSFRQRHAEEQSLTAISMYAY